MSNRGFASRTNSPGRRTTGHDTSPGGSAAAFAPPAYGIDFLDSANQALAPVQRVGKPEEEEKKPPLQGKFEDATVQRAQESAGAAPNTTGMPDALKSGIESMSGMDLSNVRVNFDSDKPAQLGAVAYTQGSAIHIASGQERHLPHEAWHVVQQRQGRVQPTMELNGAQINDDATLEREADLMGARAAAQRVVAPASPALSASAARSYTGGETVQRVVVYRMGASTDTNLCPRDPQDLTGAGRGLSTNTEGGDGKAQIIETDNLGAALEAVNDHGTHYAIRPTDDGDKQKLTAWAQARGKKHVHTDSVRAARTGTRSAKGVVGSPD